MKTKNQYAVLIAVVVAVVVSNQAFRPNDKKRLQKAVAELNAQMPKRIDDVTTQTSVELGDKKWINHYSVNATMETDAAAKAKLRDFVTKMACAKEEARALLKRGWAIDNLYEVRTTRGFETIDVLVLPSACD